MTVCSFTSGCSSHDPLCSRYSRVLANLVMPGCRTILCNCAFSHTASSPQPLEDRTIPTPASRSSQWHSSGTASPDLPKQSRALCLLWSQRAVYTSVRACGGRAACGLRDSSVPRWCMVSTIMHPGPAFEWFFHSFVFRVTGKEKKG